MNLERKAEDTPDFPCSWMCNWPEGGSDNNEGFEMNRPKITPSDAIRNHFISSLHNGHFNGICAVPLAVLVQSHHYLNTFSLS